LGSVVPPDPANVEIADVQFTTEAVSEENTVGLMAVGGILLLPFIFNARARSREGAV
jgi:hypothetical protein